MALTDKLIAIADAIRAKSGKTNSMTMDEMVTEISALSSEEIIAHADIPYYVKDAVLELTEKIKEVQNDNTITFIAMADSHHTGEQDDTDWQEYTNIGNLHASMAAKILAYILDMDFTCHLGDLTFGHGTTTSELLHQQIEEMGSYLDEAQKGIPNFWTVGNHDTGMYAKASGNAELESVEYLFSQFGARCDGAIYGSTEFGYCYRDFENKKIRVICLNTSENDTLEGYDADPSLSDEQLLWFAQTLYEVGNKSDWSVLVLSHYPLDYATSYSASHIVKAYINGESVIYNGTTINFSGNNVARFIANFHGHTHCFKYAKLNEIDSTNLTATEYDAWRVGTPNSSYYRNNHQNEDDKGNIVPDKHGILFREDKTYDKSINNANDTAFVVNVIDPSSKVIYSFCYGAGYDRTIGYGDTIYYRISNSLLDVSTSNLSTSIEHGKSYSATLTSNEHCTISSIKVVMGGVDITSTVYSNGVIDISEVTGDIIITAKASVALACTNQIPISTDVDGSIYNGVGYKEEAYITGAGTVASEINGRSVTGFIPVKVGDVIRMKNIGFDNNNENAIVFYSSNKTVIGRVVGNGTHYLVTLFGGTLNEDNTWTNLTLTSVDGVTMGAAFMRIQCYNINDNSIVTVNEEIRYADEVENSWSVTNNLTYAENDNNTTVVTNGTSYTANISALNGYALESVIVTMGGVDITDSVYIDGVITINEVTGNIIITATAISDVKNVILISLDENGDIFNGTGYKNGYRLNSSGSVVESGISSTATGFIEFNLGDKLEVIGGTWGNSACYVCAYNSAHTLIQAIGYSNLQKESFGGPVCDDSEDTTMYWDSSKVNTTTSSGLSWSDTAYIRISCAINDGANLVAYITKASPEPT